MYMYLSGDLESQNAVRVVLNRTDYTGQRKLLSVLSRL